MEITIVLQAPIGLSKVPEEVDTGFSTVNEFSLLEFSVLTPRGDMFYFEWGSSEYSITLLSDPTRTLSAYLDSMDLYISESPTPVLITAVLKDLKVENTIPPWEEVIPLTGELFAQSAIDNLKFFAVEFVQPVVEFEAFYTDVKLSLVDVVWRTGDGEFRLSRTSIEGYNKSK